MKNLPYRLSLDIGTNSIGWACLHLTPSDDNAVLPAGFMPNGVSGGVCLFPDGRKGKTMQTLNTERREHRGRRNVIRARKWRLQKLHQLLTEKLSLDEQELAFYIGAIVPKKNIRRPINIYYSRFLAAAETLSSAEQLAAVLLHMARHRYFQSNSLSESDDDDDATNWKKNEKELTEKINDRIDRYNKQNNTKHPYTVGSYYYLQLEDYNSWRNSENGNEINKSERRGRGIRQRVKAPKEIIESRPLAATRKLIKNELKQIRTVQEKQFVSQLSTENWDMIEEYILEQRPLKEQTPGFCTFIKENKRAPAALPSVAYWQILQTINNLRIKEKSGDRELTIEEREKLVKHLCFVASETNAGLRKLIGLGKGSKFTVEEKKGPQSKKIKGDIFAAALTDDELLGQRWATLPLEERDKIVTRFIEYRKLYGRGNKKEARQILSDYVFLAVEQGGLGFSPNDEDKFTQLAETILFKLDTDYANVCLEVVQNTIPLMEKNIGMAFATAAHQLGYRDTIRDMKGSKRYLPYYGQIMPSRVLPSDKKDNTAATKYGIINNVTVHVAMNQLRKLVNAIIDQYGKPQEIVVEMNRDMAKGAEERNAVRSNQDEGQIKNDEIRKEIENALGANQLPPCGWGQAFLRYKCWKIQDGIDLYDCSSTPKIEHAQVYSSDYVLDHIVPQSQGGIDKIWNLILTANRFNDRKSDQLPAEAFVDDWQQIEQRMERYIPNKLAYMKNWQQATEGKEDGAIQANMYLPRQEADAPYITKLALGYLSCICKNIWATNGYMTDAFRRNLGFYKDRKDVRNHFLDAVIVGLIDRKRVYLWNTAHAHNNKRMVGNDNVFKNSIIDTWGNYYIDITTLYDEIVPARRQKHLMPTSKKATEALHQAGHYSVWKKQDAESDVWVKVKGEKPDYSPTKDCPTKIGSRKSVTDIFKKVKTLDDVSKCLQNVPDDTFREKLLKHITDINQQGIELKQACLDACAKLGIIKIQQLAKNPYILIPRGKTKAAAIAGSNNRVEIWQDPQGKWIGNVINAWEHACNVNKSMSSEDYHYIGYLRAGDYLYSNANNTRYCIKSIKNNEAGILLLLWIPEYAFVREIEYKRNKDFYRQLGLRSREGKECSIKQLQSANMYPLQVNILGKLSPLPWSLKS